MKKQLPGDVEQVHRTSARLIVLDTEGRILLLRYADGNRHFWATPGGGLEPGETLEQTARREAAEELGATHVHLQELWTVQNSFVYAGKSILQQETFFRVTCYGEILGQAVEEFHRREGIFATRWWSATELAAAEEPIFPQDLVTRLQTLSRP